MSIALEKVAEVLALPAEDRAFLARQGEVDYLLTWNYRHLANAVVLHGLENF